MKNALFNNRLATLLEASSLQEADAALSQIMKDVGYDKFSYNYYSKQFNSADTVLHVLCTAQSQAWQTHYSARRYEQIDPIHSNMRKSVIPISWKVEDELANCENDHKQFFLEAMEFGLRGGFAVPIHSAQGEFANLVVQDFAILDHIKKNPEVEYTLHLAAHYYHARVMALLVQSRSPNTDVSLTVRETECLNLTAQHKTAKEIARILNITPRTVSFHIENIIRKLLVKNKHQAVMIATRNGLLD
jgi:LuxR family transcriptional activator of conjugal transfer of Ti plasmids